MKKISCGTGGHLHPGALWLWNGRGCRRQGRHSRHRLRLRPGADRRGLRNWTHLRLPHQPGGEPGRLGRRPHVAQGHDRLLGRPVCRRHRSPHGCCPSSSRGVGGGYNIAASGLGQDGWGPGYQGGYNMTSAIVFEFVATLIFVIVILGSTQKSAPAGICRPGHRHHPGRHSHLRHPHHRRQRKPRPQPWTGPVRRRQGTAAGLALPSRANGRRSRSRTPVPRKDTRSRLVPRRTESAKQLRAPSILRPHRRMGGTDLHPSRKFFRFPIPCRLPGAPSFRSFIRKGGARSSLISKVFPCSLFPALNTP